MVSITCTVAGQAGEELAQMASCSMLMGVQTFWAPDGWGRVSDTGATSRSLRRSHQPALVCFSPSRVSHVVSRKRLHEVDGKRPPH